VRLTIYLGFRGCAGRAADCAAPRRWLTPSSPNACRWRAVGVVTSRKPGSAGVGDALVPPLADPGLERVGFAVPAGGLDQQLVHVGFAGEPPYRAGIQAEGAADRAEGVPGREQLVHGGVPFPGAGDQAALAPAHIPQPARLGRRRIQCTTTRPSSSRLRIRGVVRGSALCAVSQAVSAETFVRQQAARNVLSCRGSRISLISSWNRRPRTRRQPRSAKAARR